uniref:RNA-dependent RNA polymerase n=1 Tax=Rodent associated picobirnavirus TaxID=2863995 RepID=A0A8K1HJB7_9VIRU|nr:RNA-dependent RNA polymerase [Rodent associated picobirnavirus]
MPKNNENAYFEQCFKDPVRTWSYFGNVVKGQSKVYDTPFAKGESTKEMLGQWKTILESIHDEWPSLFEYEIDLANKVGPMSIELPLEERMSDIESYYDGILLPSKPLMSRAILATIREYSGLGGLVQKSQMATWTDMKKSTNSGSPFFTKKRLIGHRTIPCMVKPEGDGVRQDIGPSLDPYMACAILGWRGQEGGPADEDVKQRVIWMFPCAVNIRELQVYQPLISGVQRLNINPAWVSMDAVDRRITDLFDSKSPDDLIVCTDFTKFDQHFNPDMQYAAQSILRALLTDNFHAQEWLRDVFPIKYMIPLAYNVGKVKFGKHGMASGSGGTNADETLAHRALQYEAAILAGARLNPNSQCLGDDGIICYPGITVEDVVAAYTSHGLEMNKDKQYASSQDCIYLRRWHHKDYRVEGICAGVYSTMRALGRMRYLERFMDPEVWDAEAVELRWLSILENVKYHPLKEQFVDFCMERDKYRLGTKLHGFLTNIQAVAREKINLMPDLLGYTKTLQSGNDPLGGIENWWVVNYLRSK